VRDRFGRTSVRLVKAVRALKCLKESRKEGWNIKDSSINGRSVMYDKKVTVPGTQTKRLGIHGR
jgi:hypothetical protein